MSICKSVLSNVVLAVTVLVLVVGCGGTDNKPGPEALHLHDPVDLAKFLQSTVSYDYEPFETPDQLLNDADIGAIGSVQGVKEATIERGGEDTGAAIIEIQIDKTLKLGSTHSGDSTIHFLLNRPNSVPIKEFQDSLPNGTRVAFIGYLTTANLASGQISDPLYDPAPQGFILQTSDGRMVNVWGQGNGEGWAGIHSIQELSQAFR